LSIVPYDTVEEYTRKQEGYVEHVRIRRTDDEQYPSGWGLHAPLRNADGKTLLRYDNAHERTKGHERHTADAVTDIEFPGMSTLLGRFQREVDDLPP